MRTTPPAVEDIVQLPLPIAFDRYPRFRELVAKMETPTREALKSLWPSLLHDDDPRHPVRWNIKQWIEEGYFDDNTTTYKNTNSNNGAPKPLPAADADDNNDSRLGSGAVVASSLSYDQLHLLRAAYRIISNNARPESGLDEAQQVSFLACFGMYGVEPWSARDTALGFEDLVEILNRRPDFPTSSLCVAVTPTYVLAPEDRLDVEIDDDVARPVVRWNNFLALVLGFSVGFFHCMCIVAAWGGSDADYGGAMTFIALCSMGGQGAVLYALHYYACRSLAATVTMPTLIGRADAAAQRMWLDIALQCGFTQFSGSTWRRYLVVCLLAVVPHLAIYIIGMASRFSDDNVQHSGTMFFLVLPFPAMHLWLMRRVQKQCLQYRRALVSMRVILQNIFHGQTVPHFLRFHCLALGRCVGDPRHPLTDVYLQQLRWCVDIRDAVIPLPDIPCDAETPFEELWGGAMHVAPYLQASRVQSMCILTLVTGIVFTCFESQAWMPLLIEYLSALPQDRTRADPDIIALRTAQLRRMLRDGEHVTWNKVIQILSVGAGVGWEQPRSVYYDSTTNHRNHDDHNTAVAATTPAAAAQPPPLAHTLSSGSGDVELSTF
eukprot:PhM_4_TR4812/c0_g1_i1/m.97589